VTQVVEQIRATLAAAGDPGRAAGQQAYMKSALPYHGVTLPELRRLLRPLLADYRPTRVEWKADVRALWDGATHREEWYGAIALLRHRAARPWLAPELVPLLRHCIVTGAWWDVVDEVATHPLGDALLAHPASMTLLLRGWAADEDPWIRRASVICQVGHRDATDTDLLRHAVLANVDDPTFWLRKAIGWALRDYARTDPTWVVALVEELGERLSGLSRREALKHQQ